MKKEIVIDGRMGEGGGQVLRSSLTLSLVSGRPLRIVNIRAGRRKPGLMRQHLACVRAAIAVSNGSVKGAEIHSQELSFTPGPVQAGDFTFSVGSAGSTSLVLQTILVPLLLADKSSTVNVEGGTHNAWSPPYDFLAETFLPQLRSMGAEVEIQLNKIGFHPAGGGSITAKIHPYQKQERAGTLWSRRVRGEPKQHRAIIRCSQVAKHVADKEWEAMNQLLQWQDEQCQNMNHPESVGPGNVVHTYLPFENITEVITSFGSRNKSARQVGLDAANLTQQYLRSPAPVGIHLADQLLIPLLSLGGGDFLTLTPSKHTQTNVDVIQAFYPQHVRITKVCEKSACIEVQAILAL